MAATADSMELVDRLTVFMEAAPIQLQRELYDLIDPFISQWQVQRSGGSESRYRLVRNPEAPPGLPTRADRELCHGILGLLHLAKTSRRAEVRGAIVHGISKELAECSPNLARMWRAHFMPAGYADGTHRELTDECAADSRRPPVLDHPAVAPLPTPIRMVAGLMVDMSDDNQARAQRMMERFYLLVAKPWLEDAERRAEAEGDEDDD